MILLNFAHSLADSQRIQIESLAGGLIRESLDIPTQFDENRPFAPQIHALLARVNLATAQWQEEAILVVLPSFNLIAAALLAELHGRMGYFPPVVRTRPVAGSVPRRYEVAEILDLQTLREEARRQR